jgi:class 3 adenylate cyclase
MADTRAEVPLLIAFADLLRFGVRSQRTDDIELAETIDATTSTSRRPSRTPGGTVVKFLGDAALITFPEDAVDRGIEPLLALKESVDELMARRGWACRLAIKVHFGTAVAGPYGAAGNKRYGLIGRAVNIAATLEGSGVTLSVDAFRKLGPSVRVRFRKHTPPITYIRIEDPRRAR